MIQVGLVAPDDHRGDQRFDQRRAAEKPIDRRQSRNHFVIALRKVGQQRDAEGGPPRRFAVTPVEGVDREVRQHAAVDQRRRQAGGAGQLGGPKEEWDRHRRANRVGYLLFVGVQAVQPVVVPRQPHQLPGGHVGHRDDQPVALFRWQVRGVDGQVAESPHTEVGQLAANPVVSEIAFVNAGFAQYAPRRAEQRDAGDVRRVEEFFVGQRHGQLLDLIGGQLVGAGGQNGADHRAG